MKKKQQDQGGKTWCYIQSFKSLTISNLKITALYFGNTKLFKQILNMSILIAKKKYVYTFCDGSRIIQRRGDFPRGQLSGYILKNIGHQAHKTFFQIH